LSIEALTVRLDSAVVTYQLDMSSSDWTSSSVVDIYIDMNNQRGAGLTTLLPGPDAFLFEQDGWELAIRMERYQISLYRVGRNEPLLMRTFRVSRPYQVEIPRSLFRGNPLAWGYQAVAMARRPEAGGWLVLDFLSADAAQKARMLSKKPLQLPVYRNQNP
jgi:hypothetical protein